MFAVDITHPELCFRFFGNIFPVCTSHRPIDVCTPIMLLWQNQFIRKTCQPCYQWIKPSVFNMGVNSEDSGLSGPFEVWDSFWTN